MPPNVKSPLFDMLHAALGIVQFVDGKSFEDYKTDDMMRLAVERQFAIIEEAGSRLKKNAPSVFGRISESEQIVGFRHVLVHAYDTLKDETIWRIIQEKIPILIREVEEILKS